MAVATSLGLCPKTRFRSCFADEVGKTRAKRTFSEAYGPATLAYGNVAIAMLIHDER